MKMNGKGKIVILFLLVVLFAVFKLYSKEYTIILTNNNQYRSGNVSRIHFISVGSSNATLIESNGHYGLIDTSNPYDLYGNSTDLPSGCSNYDVSSYNVYDKVVPYLESLDINSLDFVIVTHSHSDHIGGVTKLVEEGYITSNTVYYYKEFLGVNEDSDKDYGEPYSWCTDWIYEKTMEVIDELYTNNEKNKCDVTSKINKKDGTEKTVQSTCQNNLFNGVIEFYNYEIKLFNTESTEMAINDNNNSLGVLITYGNGTNAIKTFIAADMNNLDLDEYRLVVEDKNLELKDIDIFQAGHHGHVKSNTINYLKYLSPDYTIISNKSSFASSYDDFIGPYTYLKTINNGEVYLTGQNGSSIVAVMGDNLSLKTTSISNDTIIYNDNLTNFKHTTTIKNDWFYWYNAGNYITEDNNSTNAYMYFDSNGNYVTGWKKIDGDWYYFNEYGVTSHGFKKIDGKTYYFATRDDKNDDTSVIQGTMLLGWQNLRDVDNNYKKNWYYFDSDGVMLTGNHEIGGVNYLFGIDGKLVSPFKTYVIDDSKKIVTGISFGMTPNVIKNDLNNYFDVKFFNKDMLTLEESVKLKTGDIIRVGSTDDYADYAISIKGDIISDGNANMADVMKLLKHINTENGVIDGEAYLYAADYNDDNTIGVKDARELTKKIVYGN